MEHNLLTDIAISIIAAWILAVAAQLLKQPLVLAYMVAGFLIGPMGLAWIPSQHSIETIAEIGLDLLLFMIGLEIDLKKVLSTGRLIGITSLVQVLGCCVLGWLFFKGLSPLMGLHNLDVVYLAVAMALSSTVIIVKILYDKRELDTLAGRVTLGVLVLQDLFAILFLAIQPSLNDPAVNTVLLSLAKVTLLVVVAFLASRFALPPIFKAVARLPELVQVGSLAWCFLIAGLANSLGLSRAMGALIAGVAVSTYPYTLDVTAKVTSLRDFFVTLFFVGLGMAIPQPSWYFVGWSLVCAGFLVASRLVTVFPVLHQMQQGHRIGSLVSIHLSQVSEFSLVIMTLGLQSGHVEKTVSGIVAYTFVGLAVASAYGINRADVLCRWIKTGLERMRMPDLPEQLPAHAAPGVKADIFLLGFSWAASSLLEEMERRVPRLLDRVAVVDFNPQVYARLRARGLRAQYGDISQRDTLLHAGIEEARVVVCSLPNMVLKGIDNLRLLKQLRELNAHAKLVVHAELLSDIPILYAAGADFVLATRLLEARELCTVVQAADQDVLADQRADLEKELANRNEVIP